MSTARMRIT